MSSKTEYEKICAHCNQHFIAQKISTKFCSHKCSQRAYKQKLKEERINTANAELANHSQSPTLRTEKQQHFKPSDNILPILMEKEYLSAEETATLMGVVRSTIFKYCVSGKLKCIRMNRKIFIRRSDIDEMFNSAPKYEVTVKPQSSKPSSEEVEEEVMLPESSEMISDLITAKEASARYGVTKDAIHRRANAQKIPWILSQGVRMYSTKHLEEYYTRVEEHPSDIEWYSVDEIQEKYSMTKAGVYTLVSEHKVSKKNDKGRTLYSKSHIDELLHDRLGDNKIESWYTVEDIYERYGLKPHYIANFVFTNKIPKRRINGKGEYSQQHFDSAIEQRNPPTVYLRIEDAALYFKMSSDQIRYLVGKHCIPKIQDDKYIRIQKTELNKIINPPKLYISNGN